MLLETPTWDDALGVAAAAIGIYVALILCSRLVGPRSFSQMTAFDMGVTVAIGAIVGGVATGSTPLWGGVLGLAMLFALRAMVSRLRRHGLDRWVDNRPILVMAHQEIDSARLREAKITRNDVLEAFIEVRDLGHIRIGMRTIRVPESALDDYVERCTVRCLR